MDLAATAHRYFIESDRGTASARVAAIVTDQQRHGQRVGMLGLYEAMPDVDPLEIREMLEAACRYLQDNGCGIAVGPINGSTWFDYRLSVPGGGRPFLSDVHTPDEYLGHWLQAGFAPEVHYRSTAIENPAAPSVRRFDRRMSDQGVTVEGVGTSKFFDVLPEIHALSLDAFAANPFFQPIDLATFRSLYAPLEHVIDPNWALIARDTEGRALGFALAFPDLLDHERRSLVVKTVAARRDGSANGVGIWLTNLLHQRANQAGFDRIYHALMHEFNPSTRAHARSSRTYRQYVLLGRAL
ncbi:MAG: hypothetical protein P8Y69_09980 [Gammaproteobacteria bacterium]